MAIPVTYNFDTWYPRFAELVGIGIGAGFFTKLHMPVPVLPGSVLGVAGTKLPMTNMPRGRQVTGRATVGRLRGAAKRTARGRVGTWSGDPALLSRIVTLTKTVEGIGKGEIVTKLGISPNVAESALSYLRKKGTIRLRGKNRFARWHFAAAA